MDVERYVTKSPRYFKLWLFAASMAVVYIAEHYAEKAGGLWWHYLLAVCLLSFGLEILFRLIRFFFGAEIILTAEGIESKSRVRSRLTPWRDIIQAVAVRDDGVPMVVLLKAGGRKLSEKGNWDWFCMCNPGKLIRLPSEEQVHRFVANYYGGLDYDRIKQKQ